MARKTRIYTGAKFKGKTETYLQQIINSYDGEFPHDLLTKENGDPDDTQIKQAFQRFKRNTESKVQ